jgi:hypothetical protein
MWYIWAAVAAVSLGCSCLNAIVFERDVLYFSVAVILERGVTMEKCYLVKDGVFIQNTWLAYRDAVRLLSQGRGSEPTIMPGLMLA